jgi:hypothetical protein
VGPFRKLGPGEVLGVAPFVLDDTQSRFREPAALAVSPADPSSASVFLYAVARAVTGDGGVPHDVIMRTRADDARSFYGTSTDLGHHPQVVLVADQAWEGGDLSGPSALHAGDQVFLYYAAAGGIGLARSGDGLTFAKESAPVLSIAPEVAWETTMPSAPSVALLPDGSLHMLYAAGSSIGEATSVDGVTWTRVDGDPTTPALDPVLAPSAPAAPGSLAPGEKPPFDTAQVTDPCIAPRTTPGGLLQVRVLYTGYLDARGTPGRNGTIGFAARYGLAGALVKQDSPVYSVTKHEAAPAHFEWAGGSMLYVQQDETVDSTTIVPAIAAAFAPPTTTLERPAGYASEP